MGWLCTVFDPCLSPVCSLCCPQRGQLYCFSQHRGSNQTRSFAAGSKGLERHRETLTGKILGTSLLQSPHRIPHPSCRAPLLLTSPEQGTAPQPEHTEGRAVWGSSLLLLFSSQHCCIVARKSLINLTWQYGLGETGCD